MQHRTLLALLILLLALTGCSGEPETGATEVHWDRDACERCRMVLSDRMNSAQIRYWPAGKKRSKVIKFDDIGCATLWLAEQPWKEDKGVEIWVTDQQNGQWIDARTASYLAGSNTSMGYGLSAQHEPAADAMNFEQAQQHIIQVEERFNIHGAQLLERFKEQAAERDAERKATRATTPPTNSDNNP